MSTAELAESQAATDPLVARPRNRSRAHPGLLHYRKGPGRSVALCETRLSCAETPAGTAATCPRCQDLHGRGGPG